jgi:hypothetical protein
MATKGIPSRKEMTAPPEECSFRVLPFGAAIRAF